MRLFKPLLLTAGIFLSTQASAMVIHTEIGGAIDQLQGQEVVDGTETILGLIAHNTDVDLYTFGWDGGTLVIDTIGSTFDTQLHLFDNGGFGIVENDDGGPGLRSLISLNLAASSYFQGITRWNNDVVDSTGGEIFVIGGSTSANQLSNPVAGALAGWDGTNNSGGQYSINFSSAVSGFTSAQVHEPGSLALPGIGMMGFAAVRRRQKK